MIRWVSFLVLIATCRIIWNSILVARYWKDYYRVDEFLQYQDQLHQLFLQQQQLPNVNDWQMENSQLGGIRGTKPLLHNSRRKRTRPPKHSTYLLGDDSKQIHHFSTNPISVADQQVLLLINDKHLSKGKLDNHWCQALSSDNKNTNHPILPTSRIVITGIVSNPVGIDVAMTLVQQCGVRNILGLDDTIYHSHDMSERMALLLQQLPSLELHNIQLPWSEYDILLMFESFHPTHILHLHTIMPPYSYDTVEDDLLNLDSFAMRGNIDTMDTLLKTVVRYESYRWRFHSHIIKPNLVHVTIDSSERKNRDLQIDPKQTNEILFRLMNSFHTLYDVDVAQLALPAVYGPFSEGTTWMESSFLRQDIGLSTNSTIETDTLPLIHTKDATRYIITSMAQRSTTTRLSIAQNRTISKSNLLRLINKLTSSRSNPKEFSTNKYESLKYFGSWIYYRDHPYSQLRNDSSTTAWIRSAIETTNVNLHLNQTSGISPLQQRQFDLLPCHSECVSSTTCRQDHSAFNPLLLNISQEATQGCKYVLYAANFSRHLQDLYVMSDMKAGNNVTWPRETLCQVAYVSGKSRLVSSLLEWYQQNTDEFKNSNKDIMLSDLNGKLVYNDWTLVWLEKDDSTSLNEADYMMPKIAPGPLFNSNVSRAMYIETDHLTTVPPRPVMWFLMARQLDVSRQRARISHVRRSGTTISKPVVLPPTAARHTALFAHYMRITTELLDTTDILASNVHAMAKYILQQKGMYPDGKWPRRQLQSYETLLRLSQGYGKSTQVIDLMLPDTYILIHKLQSDRSRNLRCEWYEEQLFWSSEQNLNRDLEDLSLAFVLEKWRAQERLVQDTDGGWGYRIMDPSKESSPDGEGGDDTVESDTAVETFVVNATQTTPPSQYFVRLHQPMTVRKQYNF